MPAAGPTPSRLNRITLPPTWDNVYPLYLRRSAVSSIATTWTSLGGADRFPELEAGVRGAYVRVLIPKKTHGRVFQDDSKTLQGYHVMQVEETVVVPSRHGEDIRVKLEGLKTRVPIQKLSDKWPEKEELAALQNRVQTKQALPLMETNLRETVTRLATMCHFKLLQNGLEQEPVTAEAVSATYTALQEYVEEDRRRILSSRSSSIFAMTSSPISSTNKSSEPKGDLLRRRSVRMAGNSSKSILGDGQDRESSEEVGVGTRSTPIGKRKPVIANMKARRVVSLNELMKTAKSVAYESQSEDLEESESESD